MLRTFLALDLDEAFLRTTLSLIDELGSGPLPRARWVSAHALHVTIRFLGDTDEAVVPALGALVASLGDASRQPIEVRATSLLAFPGPKRAHVLALHLDEGGVIAEIAANAERAVTALGFRAEERPFRPHLTIARFRQPADLRRILSAYAEPRSGGRLVALTLYESKLGSEGPVHTPLARYDLGGRTERKPVAAI